jgi:Tfp pilus assembly protein PilF
MKNIFEFLSGNVPGGFSLYLFLIFLLLFVLYYLYRNSEIFTGRQFKKWFVIFFVIISFGYTLLWFRNPPPAILSRYSFQIFANEQKSNWLADYLNYEIHKKIKPFKSNTNYYYQYWWNYLSNTSLSEKQTDIYFQKFPVHDFVEGIISSENRYISLRLTYKKMPENEIIDEYSFTFLGPEYEKAFPKILGWIGQYLPLQNNSKNNPISDSLYYLAINEFFAGKYQSSKNKLEKVVDRFPNNNEVKKWLAYNKVKLAGTEWKNSKKSNPYDLKKEAWQIDLAKARQELKLIFQNNIEKKIEDHFLNILMAESYIYEENFAEAEIFLKTAYVNNPFNVIVLNNLSYLHPSRYRELGFSNIYEIYDRVISYCPIYEIVLIKYVEKLLLKAPVNSPQSKKASKLVNDFLEINPSSSSAWILIAEYYRSTLKKELAVNALMKADSLMRNQALVQYNLGVIYYMDKNFEMAEQHFKKAIDLNNHLDAYLYLGAINLENENYTKALEYFRYRVANKTGGDDSYAIEAMKGIRECLEKLKIPIPSEEN